MKKINKLAWQNALNKIIIIKKKIKERKY